MSEFYIYFIHKIIYYLTFRLPRYFCDIGYQEGMIITPPTFSIWFKILYRVIRRLIQHCFMSKMVYWNIKYVIATRNYEYFNIGTGP